MSINQKLLNQGLALSYNGHSVMPPEGFPHIYMGIGLWSKENKLTRGMPVDVMNMLLVAKFMQLKIEQVSPKMSSRVYILIADSMARQEGALQEEVTAITEIYKRNLKILLHLLGMDTSTELMCSSDVENTPTFKEALALVDSSPVVREWQANDPDHIHYFRIQTAMTLFMRNSYHVGIKVGWVRDKTGKQIVQGKEMKKTLHWDELRFDQGYDQICPRSMHYLYAKAGLKQQQGNEGQVVAIDGCPYTAYLQDRCYVVQHGSRCDINEICPVEKRVEKRWKGVLKVCDGLVQSKLAPTELLPVAYQEERDPIKAVHHMLNYWSQVAEEGKDEN
jgi:hypothetical protein